MNGKEWDCLPFRGIPGIPREYRLKNQMVRVIRFGTLCKLWATGRSDTCFVFCSVFKVDSEIQRSVIKCVRMKFLPG